MVDRIDGLHVADDDLEAAGTLIGDALACIFGAQTAPAAAPALAWARAQPTTPQTVAFLAGALATVLEMDAMHASSSVHPGAVVVPAALGAALATGASGESVARAVLRGTEAAIRVGRSTGVAHRGRYQSTATCGGIGAALACADLFGLSSDRSVDAMSLVGSTAGGLWAFLDEDTQTKQWHCGRTASDAVIAAQLAGAGMRGPHRLIESRRGFHAVLCGPDAAPDELTSDRTTWQIHATSYKPWPSPRPTHAAITAALTARASIAGRAIERVTLKTFAMAVDLCNHDPITTEHDARFSLRHCAAVALADGIVDFESFDRSAIIRHRELVQRIEVREDPTMTAAYPECSQAAVEIELADGRTVYEHADHALGDPERPLSGPERAEKQRRLLTMGLSSDDDAVLPDLARLHRSSNPIVGLLAAGLRPSGLPIERLR